MKKILMLVCGILMMSTVVYADCKGITVKGKYCLSKHQMNWFSAYAWCKDQGLSLIDAKEICGAIGGTCSEMILSADEKSSIKNQGGNVDEAVWTNTSIDANAAYGLYFYGGWASAAWHPFRNGSGRQFSAFCK